MENIIRYVIPKNIGSMKIEADEFIELYNQNEVVFVDVRMKFETDVWGFNFGLKIPANELPDNLEKLDKEKLIVVACPHTDRSNMARTYLASMGYKCRYLVGGLMSLAERLKGGKAKDIRL